MARLFISHSSANNAAALALRDWLSEQGFGQDDVFLDIDPERGLVAGQRWQEALKAAADRCEAVLFMVSPAWLASKWCLAEFLLAKTLHKRIFGLIIEPVPFEQVPAEMTAEWQLCELVGEDRYRTFDVEVGRTRQRVAFREAGLSLLRRGLERAGLDAKTFPWPPPGDANRAPYRGLRALEPQDAAIFFGRDAAIVRGLDRIRGLAESGVERLFVVLGASGSGKSSFLRAGLWPRLLRDDVNFLPLPVIRPESAVLTGASGLAVALTGAFERLGQPRTTGRIKDALASGAAGLAGMLEELVALAKQRLVLAEGDAATPAVVVAIDQAEELFNPEGATEAGRFLELLAALLDSGTETARRVVAVATIRSDRYELLQRDPYLSAIRQSLFNLPPLPPAEFKGVIEGPARRVTESGGRLTVDADLTERLILDSEGADALPLLAFTLERLFADYGSDGRLSLADYQRIGGVKGSIEAAVAHALARPGQVPAIPSERDAQNAMLRSAFIPWLARISPETGAPMRRVARRDEIPEAARAIVERLVEARLLVADRREGVDTIEIAHESLLRQWTALASWLEADAADLKAVEGIERAAGEWARNGRLEAWLDHRAERLAAAENIERRDDFRRRIGQEGAAYLAACRHRETQERKQREADLAREQERLAQIAAAQRVTASLQRRASITIAAIVPLVAVGLGVVWWQYRQNRNQSEALMRQEQLLTEAELARRQAAIAVETGRSNIFAGLAAVAAADGDAERQLRFAVHSVLTMPPDTPASGANGRSELLRAVHGAHWDFRFPGFNSHSVTFSPDGSRAAVTIETASGDSVRELWDAQTNRKIADLGPIVGVSFSPDGSLLAVEAPGEGIRIMDARGGNQLAMLQDRFARIKGYSADDPSAFNRAGDRIATMSGDSGFRIWSVADGRERVSVVSHPGLIESIAFSPSSLYVATASDEGVYLWEAGTGKRLRAMAGVPKSSNFSRVTFAPAGDRIAAVSGSTRVIVWNADTGAVVLSLDVHAEEVRFSPDGRSFLTSAPQSEAVLWDAETGRRIVTYGGGKLGTSDAIYAADGTKVITFNDFDATLVFDAMTGRQIAFLRNVSVERDRGSHFWKRARDHRTFSVVAEEDRAQIGADQGDVVTRSLAEGALLLSVFNASKGTRTYRLFEVETGRRVAEVFRPLDRVGEDMDFRRDGRQALTLANRAAAVWSLTDGTDVRVFHVPGCSLSIGKFSPDGTKVAAACYETAAVYVWDVASGTRVATMDRENRPVTLLVFSEDGQRLLSVAGESVRVRDTSTGNDLAVLAGHRDVETAAFSRDGSHVVTGSKDGTARVWRLSDGAMVSELRGHKDETGLAGNGVSSVSFTVDGSRVLTVSLDQTVRVWNPQTGHELTVLRGDLFSSAVFTKDGTRVVTVSDLGNTATVWDANTGRRIADLRGHRSRIDALALIDNDTKAVTGAGDGTARIWDIGATGMSTPALVTEACSKLLRGATTLSRDEMRLAGYPDDTAVVDVCASVR